MAASNGCAAFRAALRLLALLCALVGVSTAATGVTAATAATAATAGTAGTAGTSHLTNRTLGDTSAVSDTGEDTVLGGDALARSGVVTDLPAGVPAPPAPKATSWLVADLDSGDVIAASRAHRPLAPASTLKVLTALALAPHIDPDSTYTARDTDAAVDGSKVGLVPGSRYTVADLMHGLLLGSGNDCATALANLVGGTGAATELMNDEARRLGARDTVATTPHGLDAPGQVSSAYDLALVSRAALADDRVARIMAATRYRFPAGGKALGGSRKRFEIQNHNRLLRNYKGASGGKTGFTQAARHSFVGSAERGGKRYVVTMLRAEGRTWQQTAKLLDWAFGPGAAARPVGRLVTPEDVAATQTPTETPTADAPRAHGVAVRPEARGAGKDGDPLLSRALVVPLAALAAITAVGALVASRWGSRSGRRRED